MSRPPPDGKLHTNSYTAIISKHSIQDHTNTCYISSGSALNRMRAQWHFNLCLFLATWAISGCSAAWEEEMGSDADHFRDKARRDLLTLLEAVSSP